MGSRKAMADRRLDPSRSVRIICFMLSLTGSLIGVSVAFARGDSLPIITGGILFAILGLVAARSALRQGLVLRRDSITVHGLLLSRTIPRENITRIGDNASIEWRGAGDSIHTTLLISFMTNAPRQTHFAKIRDRTVQELRQWVEETQSRMDPDESDTASPS
jgi:hypothetical protein